MQCYSKMFETTNIAYIHESEKCLKVNLPYPRCNQKSKSQILKNVCITFIENYTFQKIICYIANIHGMYACSYSVWEHLVISQVYVCMYSFKFLFLLLISFRCWWQHKDTFGHLRIWGTPPAQSPWWCAGNTRLSVVTDQCGAKNTWSHGRYTHTYSEWTCMHSNITMEHQLSQLMWGKGCLNNWKVHIVNYKS